MNSKISIFIGIIVGMICNSLYSSIINVAAPGKIGECLLLHYPNREVYVEVSSNDRKEKKSIVIFKAYGDVYLHTTISFEDLKDLKATVVKCGTE